MSDPGDPFDALRRGGAGPGAADAASALAAEYVLGLLDPAEAAAVAAILPEEPALRAEVLAWQERLAGMAEDEVPAVAPPPRARGRVIAAALGEDGRQRGALRFWRAVAALGVATALGLAVALVQQLARAPAPERIAVPLPAPEVTHVARLAPTEGAPDLALAASYVAATGTLRLSAPGAAPPEGRVFELWLIPRGADAPVSLGLLAEGGGSLTVPADLAAGIEGGTLAVSDEPPGGSPTGAPTGRVLGAGGVLRL